MLFIYDYDDENIANLIKRLAYFDKKKLIKSIVLNKDSNCIKVEDSFRSLIINQNNKIITEKTFENSKIIFFYRWRMKDAPYVVSNLKNYHEKSFSEREWASLIYGLLLYYENIFSNKTWINKPSSLNLLKNKYALLSIAKNSGLKVPRYCISNKIKQLPSVNKKSQYYIVKPISSDEQIDKERYFRPSKFKTSYLEEIVGETTDCPSLIQEYIDLEYEVRSYYLLGHVLSIQFLAKEKYVDIRDVSKANLTIKKINLPVKILDKVKTFCSSLSINYCCFDFLFKSKSYYLVDITPNGSWSFYDNNFIISDWIANILISNN